MSSPNGTGNTFHKLYEGARNNENGFNCRFGNYTNPNNPDEKYNDRLPWWVHPEHNLAWFEAETRDKSPRDIAQEFLCSFNASGDTFIFHEDILKIERQCKEPTEVFPHDRNVWIWNKPERTGVYLMSCDVSRGDAGDYSGFHVIRLDTYPIEQVAEYKGKIRPDQLGHLLMAISKMYNNATIAPENNSGWSGQTILKIEEAQYPHLYFSRRRKPKEKDNSPVDPYYAMNRNDYLPGYAVTSANRLQMLAKLEQYLRMGDIKINSLRLIEELKTFVVREGNRPEAMRGYNDDLIMALAGGLWVREEAYMNTYRSDELSKALIDSMCVSTNQTRNIPGFNASANSGFFSRGQVAQHLEDQQKIILGDGSVEDISWILKG